MLTIPQRLSLIALTLFWGCLFIWINNMNHSYWGIFKESEEIGYNFARDNSVKVNPTRVAFLKKLQLSKGRVDYADIDHELFGPPTEYRSVWDTVGYGVLTGLVWKITKSFRGRDMLIVHLFIYIFMLFFFYQIALLLLKEPRFAYIACLVNVSFLPLIYLNSYVLRDIWAYYGSLVLVGGLYFSLGGKISPQKLCGYSVFIALCTWMRPTLFVAVCLALFVATLFSLYQGKEKKLLCLLPVILLPQLVLFWAPFLTYNKIAYDRYFLHHGAMLLEGIGVHENKWGYPFGDDLYADLMAERYGLKAGTPECEEKATALYWEAVREEPMFFVRAFFKLLPGVIFPPFAFAGFQAPEIYFKTTAHTLREKIHRFLKYPSWEMAVNYFFVLGGKFFQYIFMLLGYFGIYCCLRDKKYLFSLLSGAVIISSYWILFSHIEARYLIPFYWPFSLFVTYTIMKVYWYFSLIKG